MGVGSGPPKIQLCAKEARNIQLYSSGIRYLELMKSKKSKIASRLESLKEDDLSVEDKSLLDEEIAFEGEERTANSSSPNLVEPSYDQQQTTRVAAPAPPAARKKPAREDEGTAVLSEESDPRAPTQVTQSQSENESTYREITAGRNSRQETERVSYGDVYENDGGAGGESVEGLLKQAEHLRLAQEKINELESEIEDLRRENDELLSAADTFKALSEEYFEQLEKLKVEILDSRETAQQEIRILKESLHERDKQANELKQTNADLKSKVETNFKQIRKRERDLEYRLELAKVEETTLLKTKDKTILELRRRIDKLDQEMEAYREKNKEHYQKLQQQQQTVRGVVRALRIALTRLEGDFGVDFEVLKKAE
jgi:DNA repair exonuclease SbcCD ATPase subunit